MAADYGATWPGTAAGPDAQLAAQADYLVAMTRGHIQAMTNHYPRLGSRPRLLSAREDDIADPIGQDRDVYEACGRQIWEALDILVSGAGSRDPDGPMK